MAAFAWLTQPSRRSRRCTRGALSLLVVAAGAACTLITNLENHVVAVKNIVESAKADVK